MREVKTTFFQSKVKIKSLLKKAFLLICLLTLTCLSINANQIYIHDGLSSKPNSESGAQLKILSWNIAMVPVLEHFKDYDDRAEAIANALFYCDYDIIVFQEAFTSRARAIIGSSLHAHYPYVYGPVNCSKLSMRFNGGVWILSKIPLVVKKQIEFTATAGFDSFARKGAILLEGQFHDNPFQLIATHLEDDEFPQSIREKQLKEIYEKLIVPYSNADNPQIICGDFNTDEKVVENYKGLLTTLNAEDGEISGKMKITFDDELNDVYKSKHPDPRRIDYILTRNARLIQWINRKITVFKSKWGRGKQYLSDHNAIEAVISFKKLDYLTNAYK